MFIYLLLLFRPIIFYLGPFLVIFYLDPLLIIIFYLDPFRETFWGLLGEVLSDVTVWVPSVVLWHSPRPPAPPYF